VATGSSEISPAGDISQTISVFDFAAAGLSSGDKLAIYWFPGRTTASNTIPTTNFEIGGFHRTVANTPSGGTAGMVIPGDGATDTLAYFDNNITSGASGIDQKNFEAIAVPEPSTLFFLSTGTLLLLRRRR
jgi:hypothetical protein